MFVSMPPLVHDRKPRAPDEQACSRLAAQYFGQPRRAAGSRYNLYRQSIVTLIRARRYAFRDRRVRKREFRKLWIVRINAACRMRGLRYSQMINGLQRGQVILDRKTLADIAVRDPETFTKI